MNWQYGAACSVESLDMLFSGSATDHTGWFPLTCRQSDAQLGANLATTHDKIITSCLAEWIFTSLSLSLSHCKFTQQPQSASLVPCVSRGCGKQLVKVFCVLFKWAWKSYSIPFRNYNLWEIRAVVRSLSCLVTSHEAAVSGWGSLSR